MQREIWAMEISSRSKIVLLALADYGATAWPSQGKLARKCGMSRASLQRVLDGLRRDNLVATSSNGKALTYCLKLRHQMPQIEAGDASKRGRDQNNPLNYPNPTGRDGVSDEWEQRIASRCPRADIAAQRAVCGRTMAEHRLGEAERTEAFCILLRHWARTGTDAYSTLARLRQDMKGARDEAKVLMFKIRGLE